MIIDDDDDDKDDDDNDDDDDEYQVIYKTAFLYDIVGIYNEQTNCPQEMSKD
jgi:hypothetical protein